MSNFIHRVDRQRGRIEAVCGNAFILFDINGKKPVAIGRGGEIPRTIYNKIFKQVYAIHRKFQTRAA